MNESEATSSSSCPPSSPPNKWWTYSASSSPYKWLAGWRCEVLREQESLFEAPFLGCRVASRGRLLEKWWHEIRWDEMFMQSVMCWHGIWTYIFLLSGGYMESVWMKYKLQPDKNLRIWIFCHLWWHPAWPRTTSADVELVWRESHQHHQIWKDPGNCSKFMDIKKILGSIGISWISKVLEMVWILEKIASSVIKWSPQDQDCPPPPLPRWAQHSPHDQFARARQTCDFFSFCFFFLSFSYRIFENLVFSFFFFVFLPSLTIVHLQLFLTEVYHRLQCGPPEGICDLFIFIIKLHNQKAW